MLALAGRVVEHGVERAVHEQERVAIIPLEVVSEPRGLGTSGVVSLPVYCARLKCQYLPSRRGSSSSERTMAWDSPRTPASLANVVLDTRAGTMNGCGKLTREVEEGVRILTDRPELRRLSLLRVRRYVRLLRSRPACFPAPLVLQVLGGGRRRAL